MQVNNQVCRPLEALAAESGQPCACKARLVRISEGCGPSKAIDRVLFWRFESPDSLAGPRCSDIGGERPRACHLSRRELVRQGCAAHMTVHSAEKLFVHILVDSGDGIDARVHAQLRTEAQALLSSVLSASNADPDAAKQTPARPAKRARNHVQHKDAPVQAPATQPRVMSTPAQASAELAPCTQPALEAWACPPAVQPAERSQAEADAQQSITAWDVQVGQAPSAGAGCQSQGSRSSDRRVCDTPEYSQSSGSDAAAY